MTAATASNGHSPGLETETLPLILVADNDPAIGCVLSGALNRAGFNVELFQEASKIIKSADGLKPDVAVVDRFMPDMDGLSLIDRLKAGTPGLATILIVGHSEREEAVEQALLNGRVDAVLVKPFRLADFLNTVSCLAGNKALASEARADQPKHTIESPLTDWLTLDGHEAYFEQILGSLIDAVIMLDNKGRVIYWNNGALRTFGWRDQIGGLSLADFCPTDNLLANFFAQFFGNHPPVQEQSEGYFVKADGTRFYTIFSASLFQAGAYGSAVLLVIKDIHARHMLFEQITAETRKLEHLALTDPLTGLYNRRYFDQRLADEFRRLERYHSPLTLAMIDFDFFKQINDNFGHLVGDQVLRQGAEIFGRLLRDVDILSRWGGEEYMVLLPETTGERGLTVARRLHGLIRAPEQWEKLAPGLRVTVSIGMISLPWAEGRPASINDVLETMDRALYRAKNSGRDRIVRYLDDQDSFVEA